MCGGKFRGEAATAAMTATLSLSRNTRPHGPGRPSRTPYTTATATQSYCEAPAHTRTRSDRSSSLWFNIPIASNLLLKHSCAHSTTWAGFGVVSCRSIAASGRLWAEARHAIAHGLLHALPAAWCPGRTARRRPLAGQLCVVVDSKLDALTCEANLGKSADPERRSVRVVLGSSGAPSRLTT